jgi:hypothetical protein
MGGYHLWYVLYKMHIKTEMKRFIDHHPDTEAACHFAWQVDVEGNIEQPNFFWNDKNHEFTYNGLLYDVVHIQYSNKTVTICCLPDEAENCIDLQHFALQKNKQDAGKPNKLSFSQIFSYFYQPSVFHLSYELVNACHWHPFFMEYLYLIPASVVLPPPREILC